MASDYAAITSHNIARLGDDPETRKSQVCMYSHYTHFVYEILQNADDYNATEVVFSLTATALTIEHNGDDFTPDNVKAISYFGQSTSRADLVKTGHFGLGFKSVFAFTSSPQVHSGDEHFEVHGLYQLRPVTPPADLPQGRTRFVLPFDHQDVKPNYVEDHVSAERACSLIGEKLANLDMDTLLFTRNVREIRWQTGAERGHYYRSDRDTQACSDDLRTRTTDLIDDKGRIVTYRVWARPIAWEGRGFRDVEIAFRLADDGKLLPITKKQRSLIVLFATSVDTDLGFLVNGPFRTNPARESVNPEVPFNQHLVKQLARLSIDVLRELKKLGTLDVPMLATMPIREEDFPDRDMFRPLFDAVRDALLDESLLPAHGGGYVAGEHALLAGAKDLADLLSSEQLASLHPGTQETAWVSTEITERGASTGDLWKYLNRVLKVDEMAPESFVRKLNPEFLEAQDDEWMCSFYDFLGDKSELWRGAAAVRSGAYTYTPPAGPLRQKPFIRLQDKSHTRPFNDANEPLAYLPRDSCEGFPVVRACIAADDEARSFLEALGLAEPDLAADVERHILPRYAGANPVLLSDDEHHSDVRRIIDAYPEASDRLRGKLKVTPFLRAHNAADDSVHYMPPKSIHLAEECRVYLEGNPDAWLLSAEYDEHREVLVEMGVKSVIEVKRSKKDGDGYVELPWRHSDHTRGLDGFAPDCEIEGLSFAVEHPNSARSEFVWNELLCRHAACIRGEMEKATHQNYDNATRSRQTSPMGALVIDHAWVPTPDGAYARPCELTVAELPADFRRFDPLLQALRVGEAVQNDQVLQREQDEAVAARYNITPERLRQYAERSEEIDRFLARESAKVEKRNRLRAMQSVSTERRIEHIKAEVRDRVYEPREQSVRTSVATTATRQWLRERYTDHDDGEMTCQLCAEEMPFKKRDGEYYFEAVGIFDDIPWEHTELYLALCPNCAAKYREYIKNPSDGQQRTALETAILDPDNQSTIWVTLDREEAESIVFHPQHLADIRTVLESVK